MGRWGDEGEEHVVDSDEPLYVGKYEVRNGEYRVYRGGGWAYYARYCRCACRGIWEPGIRNDYLGFRLVLAARGNRIRTMAQGNCVSVSCMRPWSY